MGRKEMSECSKQFLAIIMLLVISCAIVSDIVLISIVRRPQQTVLQDPQWGVYYPDNEVLPNSTVVLVVQSSSNSTYVAKFEWSVSDSYGTIGEASGTFEVVPIPDLQVFLVSVQWSVPQSQVAKLIFCVSFAACKFTVENAAQNGGTYV